VRGTEPDGARLERVEFEVLLELAVDGRVSVGGVEVGVVVLLDGSARVGAGALLLVETSNEVDVADTLELVTVDVEPSTEVAPIANPALAPTDTCTPPRSSNAST
jgi:hypothetical protein